MHRRSFSRSLLALAGVPVVFTLAACGGYELRNLAKSDINLVTDEFIVETRRLVRELMIKLYRRNPRQLELGHASSIAQRLQQLRDTPGPLAYDELERKQEIAALELVFDEGFRGDRVFALTVGLGGMLRRAYGYDTESFMFDSQDPDILETSARNIEILLWRLKHNRDSAGEPFLITSEYNGRIDNLSFERLFGKLIALQDMMAVIAGDAGDRRVTKVVHTATSVFIPLPL